MTNEQTGTVLLSEGKTWITTDREVLEDRLVALEKFVAKLKACSKGERPFSPEPEPKPVDPDLAEAGKIAEVTYCQDCADEGPLLGIKRGRELERAEKKPGMVWVKHDGSAPAPVPMYAKVLIFFRKGFLTLAETGDGQGIWPEITYYAIITQPEEK
jgi:hypothetical protein